MSVILGGGAGRRLFPLTKDRATPAVPLGAKYRLVDIPISNCVNSNLRRICVLTQFNSVSLHRHIAQAYKFDHFARGFVEILAAEQTLTDSSWYLGTADAVRKNLGHLLEHPFDHLLVLSGDHLYRMDYRSLIDHHVQHQADITVATSPVERRDVPAFGIVEMTKDHRICRFVEKPTEAAVQDSLRLEAPWDPRLGLKGDTEYFLASMGVYLIRREALVRVLDSDHSDFGDHVMPAAVDTHHLSAYVFPGYWRDIGTVRSFFEANLDLTAEKPQFNFYDLAAPIFTQPRALPASRIDGGSIVESLVADGCHLQEAKVSQSLLGLSSVVREGSELHRTVMMGTEQFDSEEWGQTDKPAGAPPFGVGRRTKIENAIIDKNASIGDDCVLTPRGKPSTFDHPHYYIRDGIIIVPRKGIVPDGTVS